MNKLNNIINTKYSENHLFIFFGALVLVTRVPFVSSRLFEWDSVQYALSIQDFDILWHQPHPPGYIFYSGILKLSSVFFTNENQAIIACSILFSLLTVLVFVRLAQQVFRNNLVALMATLILVFSPPFWFYGDIAAIYTAEAFLSSLIGCLLFESIQTRNQKGVLLSSILLGIAAGFRQTILIVLFPLVIYSISRFDYRRRLMMKCFAVLAGGCLLWFIPTIFTTGGLGNYLEASSGLTQNGADRLDILFGGTAAYLLQNLSNFAVWLSQILNPLGTLVLILSIALRVIRKMKIHISQELVFMWIWLLPSLILYMVYIEKPGYLLSIITPLILIASRTIFSGLKSLGGKQYIRNVSIVGVILATSSIAWFTMPGDSFDERITSSLDVRVPALSDYTWDISYREIHSHDEVLEQFEGMLSQQGLFPDNTILIFVEGFPTWRHLMYYENEFSSYWFIYPGSSGLLAYGVDLYESQYGNVTSLSGAPFWMNNTYQTEVSITVDQGIENVVWLLRSGSGFHQDLVQMSSPSTEVLLSNNQAVVITPIQDTFFHIAGLTIRR